MVEHGVSDGEETEPSIGYVLGDGGTQSPEGGDVVQRADEEGPDHHFGVDGGSAVVWTVAVLQRNYKLAKIELLVNSDQQMVGIDKVPQAASG